MFGDDDFQADHCTPEGALVEDVWADAGFSDLDTPTVTDETATAITGAREDAPTEFEVEWDGPAAEEVFADDPAALATTWPALSDPHAARPTVIAEQPDADSAVLSLATSSDTVMVDSLPLAEEFAAILDQPQATVPVDTTSSLGQFSTVLEQPAVSVDSSELVRQFISDPNFGAQYLGFSVIPNTQAGGALPAPGGQGWSWLPLPGSVSAFQPYTGD
jgi:hypothetical protein